MKKYELTPEHRERFGEYVDKWTKIAFSTGRMDDATKEKVCDNIIKIYELANLKPPPRERIVIAPSPFSARFAAGFAAHFWSKTNNATDNATRNATYDATYDATSIATSNATSNATYDATHNATDNATRNATYDATHNATNIATSIATYIATDNATYDATYDATSNATRIATYIATDNATDNATYDATYDATSNATRIATRIATYNATYDATYIATDNTTRNATYDATYIATDNATRNATYDATYIATDNATYDATYDATRNATSIATDDATYDATRNATYDATNIATSIATNIATHNATNNATDDATRNATYDATNIATSIATDDATYDATSIATHNATYDATRNDYSKEYFMDGNPAAGANPEMIQCARDAWKMYQGGNMWAGHLCYGNFFMEVAKLPIDWNKWTPWEYVSSVSGFRFMHPEFCIISELPIEFHVNDRNEGHNETGPYIRWADNSAIYMIDGVLVPAWLVEFPEELTLEKIDSEKNAEIRRVMMQRYGVQKYILDTDAQCIDFSAGLGVDGSAPRALYMCKDGSKWLFCSDGSTKRIWWLPAPNDAKTCKETEEALNGYSESCLVAEC